MELLMPVSCEFNACLFSCSGAQAVMSGSNPLLGCNSAAGISLSGLLPSGGLLPSALPGPVPAASPSGQDVGNNNLNSRKCALM